MKNIFEVQNKIEGLLLCLNHYTINIKDTMVNVPLFTSSTNTIDIGNCEYWNQVYQLSHELLHAAFNEKCHGTNKVKYRWIEEILCEAFSIYCLKQFCRDDYQSWKLYLHPYMYYINENCTTREIISSEGINNINSLNEKLLEKKSYETLQFIHPLCLLIVNVIDTNIFWLYDLLDFTKYIDENDNFINCDNEIIMLLQDFIILHRLDSYEKKS